MFYHINALLSRLVSITRRTNRIITLGHSLADMEEVEYEADRRDKDWTAVGAHLAALRGNKQYRYYADLVATF